MSESIGWIPVVAALSGAAVGFLGGIANSVLAFRKKEQTEREQRQRDRIERAYELLTKISMDYKAWVGDVVQKVHFGKEVTPKSSEGVPPLLELEMLIDLYFRDFKKENGSFIEARDNIGKMYATVIVDSIASRPQEEKKKVTASFLYSHQAMENSISVLKKRFSELAKI